MTGYVFGPADVGKVVAVMGAGAVPSTDPLYPDPPGDQYWLNTTIASVSSGTGDAVMADPAVVAVTAQPWEIGTDNTSVFQHRIDHGTGGQTFLLPEGEWLITEAIRLDGSLGVLSGNQLVGVGRGSQLVLAAGEATVANMIRIMTGSGFSIRDLRLTGNAERGGVEAQYVSVWDPSQTYTYSMDGPPVYVSVPADGTQHKPPYPPEDSDGVWLLQYSTDQPIDGSGPPETQDMTIWAADGYFEEAPGVNNRFVYDATFDGHHGIYVNGVASTLSADLAASETGSLSLEDASAFPESGVGWITNPNDPSASRFVEEFSWSGKSGNDLTGLSRYLNEPQVDPPVLDAWPGPSTAMDGLPVPGAAVSIPVRDVEISGVEIEQMVYGGIVAGSGPVQPALIGGGCVDVRIVDCDIHDCSSGIGGARRSASMVSNSRVQATGNVINVDQEGLGNTIVGNVLGGTFKQPARYGCSSYQSDDVTCTGNTFRNCETGVAFQDTGQGQTRGGAITGNVFTGTTNTCISLDQSPNTTVCGNYGYEPRVYFVSVTESQNSVISDNVAYDAAIGFQVTTCEAFVMTGNTAWSCRTGGFRFYGASDGTLIGNSAYNSGPNGDAAGFFFGDDTADDVCRNIVGSGNQAVELRSSGATQQYGVYLAAGCEGIAIFDGGRFTGNTMADVNDASGANPNANPRSGSDTDRRDAAERPTDAQRETVRRDIATTSLTAQASGTTDLTAIWLCAGDVLSGIACLNGATAASMLQNLYFELYEPGGTSPVMTTINDGTSGSGAGTWANQSLKSLAWSSGMTYTVPVDGLYLIGIYAATATGGVMPALRGANGAVDAVGLSPALHSAAGSALAGRPYCYVY